MLPECARPLGCAGLGVRALHLRLLLSNPVRPEWHRADPTPVAQLCQGSACSSKQRKALTATLPSCPHAPHCCCFSLFIYIPPTSTISWCWTQSTQRDSVESYKKEEGKKTNGKQYLKEEGKEGRKEKGRKEERERRQILLGGLDSGP